ncbi:hypothetical protein B0J11DRAFT_599163 [Dendryphion nanum]|uniref:Uncharacterized protein n=1 Tax=Dendryphion nanum TaxID=256645 RepID=A0A9P9D1F9_9PLEO|nr:hypothetical protein B0J11DRAFT_599163 [Dendryphion nanum]
MKYSYRIFRTWAWEIFFTILSIGLIIAIGALLYANNGKRTPDWGMHVNLNAILALLSTTLRATLVVIVSQVISQRKWIWYDNGRVRPLSDLQKFDTGSRGPLGAFMLMPTVLWRDLVTLGATMVLLASFLIGPSVQQASRTTECSFPVPGQTASLPFAHYVPSKAGYGSPEREKHSGPTQDSALAILSAVISPEGIENQISGICSTGNCTFTDGDPIGGDSSSVSAHNTVGMCSKCTNIAQLVSRIVLDIGFGNSIMYRLPNGFIIACHPTSANPVVLKSASNLDWLGDMFTPDIRTASRWAYVNATFLSTDCKDKGNTTAVVCNLYPCVRTYTSSITNNRLREENINSQTMQIELSREIKSHMLNNGSVDNFAAYGQQSVGLNSGNNSQFIYAAVKTPCLVNRKVDYVAKNMTSSPETEVYLFNLVDYGKTELHKPTYERLYVSEQCIYRQHPRFAAEISSMLSEDIFEGECSKSVNGGLECFLSAATHAGKAKQGFLSDLGMRTALVSLYNDGKSSYDKTTRWFDSFATAMTSKFRSKYGSQSYNETMATHWEAFPPGKHRNCRPVWKENILPLIVYSQKFASSDSDTISIRQQSEDIVDNKIDCVTQDGGIQGQEPTAIRESRSLIYQEDRMLEASEMKEIAGNIVIDFQWPAIVEQDSKNSNVDSRSSALSTLWEKLRLRRQNRKDPEGGRDNKSNGDEGQKEKTKKSKLKPKLPSRSAAPGRTFGPEIP